MKITQIRNATIWVEYHQTKILVDPWLGPKEYMPGFVGAIHSERRQPCTELPFPMEQVVEADAVILTHVHPDHWDQYAEQSLRKNIPFFVQSEADLSFIASKGFKQVHILSAEGTLFREISLYKVPGQHGEREKIEPACRQLGLPYDAMGVIMQAMGEKTLYLAGDTIFCAEVKKTLERYRPEVIVVNACAACVESGDRLIMDEQDVAHTSSNAPQATIVVSHMDEVSHRSLSRQQLQTFVQEHKLPHIYIPANGESLVF